VRIAMVSEHASPLAVLGEADANAGGQHTHVAQLSIALARLGHEVHVYTRKDRDRLPDQVSFQEGVIVRHVLAGPARPLPTDELLPFMGDFGRWLAARWMDERERPDVVHAHFWTSGLAALTATAESRIPVVVTFHVLGSVTRRCLGELDTSPATRVGLERQLGTLADRVVAQCDDEVSELGRMGIRRADTVVVPSGVDIDRYTPGEPSRSVRPPATGLRRVVSVGRLVQRKGFADLIAAIRQVPNAELVILGGPPGERLDQDPEAKRLRAFAEHCGVADRVHLHGAVRHEDMPAWYRSADVVACAPWYEPFGLTPLEAMACGVPVVAYAVGGIAASVIDGVTGTLVPPRDIRALALALRGLLGDEVRRMSYASAAVDRVRSRYTWDRTAFNMERVYAEAAGIAHTEAEADGAQDGADGGTDDPSDDADDAPAGLEKTVRS
jgi:D-inositol-3-phosphate glycosyltransferase